MGRLNVLLLVVVLFCSARVVELQYQARSLFVALGEEEEAARQLGVALTHLQLSQEALAKGERVDEIARKQLKMVRPIGNALVYMPLEGGRHE
jgi:cell division protein FtsL